MVKRIALYTFLLLLICLAFLLVKGIEFRIEMELTDYQWKGERLDEVIDLKQSKNHWQNE